LLFSREYSWTVLFVDSLSEIGFPEMRWDADGFTSKLHPNAAMRLKRALGRMGAAVRSDRRSPSVFDNTQRYGYPCLMPRHRTTTHPEVLLVKSYLFHVKIEQEDDGRWRPWIETLPGFAAWDYSEGEALDAVKETAQVKCEVLVETGQHIPEKISQTFPKPHRPQLRRLTLTRTKNRVRCINGSSITLQLIQWFLGF
jgi:predicted RNase H-like HicB family nuclease